MYRALEYMNVVAPKGGTILMAPGDPIEDFENWPPWTQHCLVDEKRVRWAPEGITDAEKRRARPWQPPVAQVEPDPEPEVLVVEVPPTDALAPASLKEERHDSLPPMMHERVSTEAIQVTRKQGAQAAPTGGMACNVCQRSGFKDAVGLKIHMNKAHKGM